MSAGFFVRYPSYANSVTGSIPKYNGSEFVLSSTPSVSSFSLTTVTSGIATSDVTPAMSPWPHTTPKNLPDKFRELVYSLTKGGNKSYSIRNQSGALQTDATGPVLVTYTAESTLEIEHNSTQTNRSGIPRVSSRFAQLKSGLRKLWKVLTQSLKRHRRHVQPNLPQETTSIKSVNDVTLQLSGDAIEQVCSPAAEVSSSTPRIPHHPPVLYPTQIDLSISSLSSWNSLSSIGSHERDVSLLDGSFTSGSVTLSLFSEADDSTNDFIPCQLSFNSP